MGGGMRLQFADDICVTAEREVSFDPVLQDAGPQFLQPCILRLRERFIADIGQRRTPPQRQRLPANRRRPAWRAPRPRATTLPGETLETANVDVLTGGPQ